MPAGWATTLPSKSACITKFTIGVPCRGALRKAVPLPHSLPHLPQRFGVRVERHLPSLLFLSVFERTLLFLSVSALYLSLSARMARNLLSLSSLSLGPEKAIPPLHLRSSVARVPCTLHPAPCTLHPAPCTLHLAHCTLHPTPPSPGRGRDHVKKIIAPSLGQVRALDGSWVRQPPRPPARYLPGFRVQSSGCRVQGAGFRV